jgi:amidohydrolase
MNVSEFPTSSIFDDMVAWRHDFHIHPELGFDEHRTGAKVAELLESWGIDVHTGIGGTGVVGVLQRGNSLASIGIRADMDALPINETSSHAYTSNTEDVMHACGHDGHTTMLLGAAKRLAEDGSFDGRVLFIFQPNEEHGLGALSMLEDRLFEQHPVDEVYGMHNIPGMPLNHFATRNGPITASESLFEIHVAARGGHAALPHMGVDAITVGSQIVNALQTIVSRKLNPGLNGVVSVTEFVTDGSRNVLPGSVVLKGDARALTPDINAAIEQNMRQIVDGVCAAHGVTATVTYDTIFQPIINDSRAASDATAVAGKLLGSQQVDGGCEPKLFSEDFAHFASAVPGCFVLMGNGVEGANARPLHSSDYDFNDDLLVAGSSFWVNLIEHQLKKADS